MKQAPEQHFSVAEVGFNGLQYQLYISVIFIQLSVLEQNIITFTSDTSTTFKI